MLERQEEVLLIGHQPRFSHCLRYVVGAFPPEGVKGKVDFLTLGSPLGMHYVQRRLLGMDG